MNDFFSAIGKLVFSIAMLAASSTICAVIALSFWDWFVIPLGAPVISLVSAVGIIILIRLIGMPWVDRIEEGASYGKHIERFFLSQTAALLTWAVGWCVHLFL
jgi:hypothetical protein